MFKFLLFTISLLGIGIALTLSLPEYKTGSKNTSSQLKYTVDADSLKKPRLMTDYFLETPTPPDAQFALRLGLNN